MPTNSSPSPAQRPSLPERVRLFTHNLRLALFDRQLELKGIPVFFYYDTDVVLRMIMGFESELDKQSLPDEPNEDSRRQRLVRALLSCHYLGDLDMLRPHALELDNAIRRHPRYLQRAGTQAFKAKINQYLRQEGLGNVMTSLSEIMQRTLSDQGYERRADDFLDTLRQTGGETFAAIEQVNGAWHQRLRRYHDAHLLRFDHLGMEMKELFAEHSDVLGRMATQIDKERSGPRATFPNYQDAAALTLLRHMIRQHEEGQEERVVRFYTETRALLDAFTRPGMLRLLSYSKPVHEEIEAPPGGDFVVRDSRYFLLRAVFEELSPGSPSVPLDRLHNLADRLSDLLDRGQESSEQALRRALDESQFQNVIEQFSTLELMESIWVKKRAPKLLVDSLEKWTEIFNFARSETAEALQVRIEDVERTLDSQLTQIRRWMDDFNIFKRQSDAPLLRIDVGDPMRDLGLVRWGYELSKEGIKELTSLIKALREGRPLVRSTLANRMSEAREDANECMVMSAILWSLGYWREIIELVNELKRANPDVPSSLELIGAAAEIRSGQLEGLEERRKLIERINRVGERLPENGAANRGGFFLGFGYILYHAWKNSVKSESVGPRESELARLWAQQSFEVGEQAFQLFSEDTLGWAFAVNHCTYVGIRTGVELEKMEKYYGLLIQLENNPHVWNNRFFDTVACYHLRKFRNLWDRNPNERGPELVDTLKRLLKTAEIYLTMAEARDSGDIDLREHNNEFIRYQIWVADLPAERGPSG